MVCDFNVMASLGYAKLEVLLVYLTRLVSVFVFSLLLRGEDRSLRNQTSDPLSAFLFLSLAHHRFE